jgi:hypothetical protein
MTDEEKLMDTHAVAAAQVPTRVMTARRVAEAIVQAAGRGAGKIRKINAFISPPFLVPPRAAVMAAAMALVSALVMTLEAVQFHMLLLVADYVTAMSAISMALIGIAIGGFLAFVLAKARPFILMSIAAACLFASLWLSYLGLADFPAARFPLYLSLPYIAASIVISVILDEAKSTIAYFVNLLASGVGAVAPIILVPMLKSEGTLFLLTLVPIAVLAVFSLRIRNLAFKLAALALLAWAGISLGSRIFDNLAAPERIAKAAFESKILPEMASVPGEKAGVNFALEFLSRAYERDKAAGVYRCGADEYDRARARRILGILGFAARPGLEWLSRLQGDVQLADPFAIPERFFEDELAPAARRRFGYGFRRDYDLEFLRSAYELKGEDYVLTKEPYARERAKLLLADLGHIDSLDLSLDIRRNGFYTQRGKSFNENARIVLDRDSLLGRVQFTRSGDRYNMAINGTILDNLDPYNGNYYDPRVPYLENAKVFIVGLSADGIAKSAKRHPGARVYGAELNPVIWESMTDGGYYQSYSDDPYKDIVAKKEEARSWLEDTEERFDIITLMNIHQDSGPASTLGPEYFHTVEATRMMLDRLTERGMIVYEEIVIGRRSELAFVKMMNTIKASLRAEGQADPGLCIHVAKWDFWGGDDFRTVSVKKSPFTKGESAAMASYFSKVKETGNYSGVAVVYDPAVRGEDPIDAAIRGPDILSLRELPGRIEAREFAEKISSPARDSRDIQFAMRCYPYGGDGYHYLKAGGLDEADRRRLERLMDRAGYSLDIDLSPTYDDSPFPFDVYAKKSEIIGIFAQLLPLILFLAVPLLVILLRSAEARGASLLPPVAFAAISGFGYMLVEVVLMQKLQLFIGDPTQALVLVLGGMLMASGLGSFASGRIPRRAIIALVAAVPILLALYAWRMDSWFLAFRGLRGAARLAVAGGLILPLAFLMGMPFPYAMETLKARSSRDFASLLFGVNGLASTIGSVTAFYVNVNSGYTRCFAIGTACYAAATALFAYFVLRGGKGRATA